MPRLQRDARIFRPAGAMDGGERAEMGLFGHVLVGGEGVKKNFIFRFLTLDEV